MALSIRLNLGEVKNKRRHAAKFCDDAVDKVDTEFITAAFFPTRNERRRYIWQGYTASMVSRRQMFDCIHSYPAFAPTPVSCQLVCSGGSDVIASSYHGAGVIPQYS